jgi:hypothetical protein
MTPLKEGQQVFIKNPRGLEATVVKQRPGDKELPEEDRRYIVNINVAQQLYHLADLEAIETKKPDPEIPVGFLFAKGDYVRLKMAPQTRMGTIEASKAVRGRAQYHFRQDQRFREGVPGAVFEAWVPEGELEICARPSDQYVAAVNTAIKMGS